MAAHRVTRLIIKRLLLSTNAKINQTNSVFKQVNFGCRLQIRQFSIFLAYYFKVTFWPSSTRRKRECTWVGWRRCYARRSISRERRRRCCQKRDLATPTATDLQRFVTRIICRRWIPESFWVLFQLEIAVGLCVNRQSLIRRKLKTGNVCRAVCLSDEYQRLNYLADWAQTAYRCQVGPDDGFRLGPIPIGR